MFGRVSQRADFMGDVQSDDQRTVAPHEMQDGWLISHAALRASQKLLFIYRALLQVVEIDLGTSTGRNIFEPSGIVVTRTDDFLGSTWICFPLGHSTIRSLLYFQILGIVPHCGSFSWFVNCNYVIMSLP